MELDQSLLKDFASVVNSSDETGTKKDSTYGEVTRIADGVTYVRLDGADEGVETPVTTLVEVGVGDRVAVDIANHTAVATGNISFPALTRVGDVYIRLTDAGFLIGRVDEHNQPVGQYIIVGPDGPIVYNEDGEALATFGVADGIGPSIRLGAAGHKHIIIRDDAIFFRDENNKWLVRFIGGANSGVYINNGTDVILAQFTSTGMVLRNSDNAVIARFTASEILLGDLTSAQIKLCGTKGIIVLEDDTLKISGSNNVGAVGLTNKYGNYKSEVIAEAKSSSQRVGMQVMNGTNTVASVIASKDGCNVTVPSGKVLSENGVEVVKVNSIVATGTISWSERNPASGSTITYSATANVPNGYTLIGIGSINFNDYNWAVERFYVSGKNVYLTAVVAGDVGKPHPENVSCKWFAIRTSGANVQPDQHIDL